MRLTSPRPDCIVNVDHLSEKFIILSVFSSMFAAGITILVLKIEHKIKINADSLNYPQINSDSKEPLLYVVRHTGYLKTFGDKLSTLFSIPLTNYSLHQFRSANSTKIHPYYHVLSTI